MYPCSTCDRHLRDSDRLCPFCGTVQSTVVSPCFGTLALAVVLLGSTACAKEPGSEGSTAGTTTSMTTTNATESSGESSDTSTSTTDGDGDGETTNDSISTSGSFYAGPEVDYGGGPYGCDPWVQDCPDGEKCVPYSSDGEGLNYNKCVVITGSGEPGDACYYGGIVEATDDCGPDSHCWADDDVGVCLAFCTGTPDAPMCPDGFQCLIDGEGSVNLCTSSCNPLLQDCSPGTACYFNDGFECLATTEDIALGEPCEVVNECALGLLCLPGVMPTCDGNGCCASYCDLSAPVCEQMGTECVAFFSEDPPTGYEDVGVCIFVP